MLGVISHVAWTGWMSPTRCNMSWFENLAIRMRLYNYYGVLHNFIKVRRNVKSASIFYCVAQPFYLATNTIDLNIFFVQMILSFAPLNYMFATTLLVLETSPRECL